MRWRAEARAQFDGPERTVHLRVAEQEGHIYLDLADTAWRAVEVGPHGWRVVAEPPVRFRRPAGLLALPMYVLYEVSIWIIAIFERSWKK